jgi:molecular chaperone HtpG
VLECETVIIASSYQIRRTILTAQPKTHHSRERWMKIPNRLSSLLETNDNLNGAVLQTIGSFRPWFEDNKLVFFPEYTDHGPKHIQEVFETTESLISESSWPLLRSEDVATLILGIIPHDCAMHLSEDGFLELINDKSRPLDEGFRDKPWPQLWDEFMAEARRGDLTRENSKLSSTTLSQFKHLHSILSQ